MVGGIFRVIWSFSSCFSGIGGSDLGFEKAGFRVIRHCEINKFKSQVLKRHWPDAEHFADIAKIRREKGLPQATVEWGSPPCQDLSIAGKHRGLAGSRSGLFHEWIRYLESNPPAEFAVMEQVSGLFSSNAGKDFSDVLGAFCGWTPPIPSGGWRNSGVCFGPKGQTAWRTLDARYLGVAQRRRRVFFVRDFRGERAGKVLFESEGGKGYFTPISRQRNRASDNIVSGTLSVSGEGRDQYNPIVVSTLKARYDSSPRSSSDGLVVAPTIRAGSSCPDSGGRPEQGLVVSTLRTIPGNRAPQGKCGDLICTEANTNGIVNASGIPEGLVLPSDAKIYQAAGDAVCVNVARWIANKIKMVLELADKTDLTVKPHRLKGD